VCAKPITMNERSQIDHNVDVEVERLRGRKEELERQSDVLWQRVTELREDLKSVSDIYDALVHGRIRSISPDTTLEQLIPLFQEAKDAAESVVSVVDARLNAAKEALARLDNERAEYAEINGRLKALGFNTVAEARRALIDLEMRSLTLRASKAASSKVQATLRDADLQPIYAQVSKVWAAFSGKENWQVKLDEKGMPTLTSREGRTFDLSQFSGGEKTALLLMLHTIIAQHFSKSDFLLVDEPLEHLDPINRRSLVRFLIDASKRGSFKQALVATFEESLLRKYMSEEGVHIVHV
ncbi:MAG: AAA family ATPase, partial [Anaerolineae bacterium]